MSSIFYLAIPAGRLDITVLFYNKTLGCRFGPFEKGKWQDVDFWRNELTLHETPPRSNKGPERERHSVEMGSVCVPHFGIHLDWHSYLKIKQRIEDQFGFLDVAYIRFQGQKNQQETFFVEDPNFNVLEIKSIQGSFYNNVKL